ncbi:MAG: zinc-ribbon domain-containing protein [Myxococcales bacterium]|nr:zinc-ribbon domain-containing protein [Myxococcales bacterium]
MKIVCDNCGAKYSIADEKVAGKVFKIRCKKCTHVIVVRGDQVAEGEQAAAAQGFDYGGEAVWHVVVDGDQQGPFSPDQLAAMMTEGTIDWEAYVWKEGFDGWKPARDIPELVTAISGEPAQDDAGGGAFGAAAAGGDLGEDPFAGAAAASPFGQVDAFGAAPAARASSDAGADLFAQSDPASSPFGGGVDDDVVASTPSPRVSAEQASMTGQRNENSVLFSLSNLQALATGGPASGPSAPTPLASSGPKAGHATGEGSGLIDIRALASATASTGSGGAGRTGEKAAPDDLLSIGGSGGLGSSLGAPVLAPVAAEPEKDNKPLIIGLSVAGVAVVGLIVALVVILTRPSEPVAAVATGAAPQAAGGELANPNAATPSPAAATAIEAAVPAPAAAAPTAMAEEAAAADSDSDSSASGSSSGSGSRGSSAMRDRGGSASAPAARSTSMDSAPAAAAAPAAMTGMASGSIDDLLDRALGGGGTPMASAMAAAAPAAMSNLPDQPSPNEVRSALQGVARQVQSCGGGSAGVATAAITFANTGRVSNVNVTGVPPAVQSCVARGVRNARVSPFSRPTLNVNFPFRVQ